MSIRSLADTYASHPERLEDYTIERRGRYWAVSDHAGELVCLTVYRRGAREVVRRLTSVNPPK